MIGAGNDCASAAATVGAELISERLRQQNVEGFDNAQDDSRTSGELAWTAVAYIRAAGEYVDAASFWPWSPDEWNPKDARRNLVRAGALLIAEIERLDRAAAKKG